MIVNKNSITRSEYDVLIVGAGPAGCSAAFSLPEDINTLIIDRLQFPRSKVCGGVLIEKSWKFLRRTGLDIPESVFAEPGEMPMKITDMDNNFQVDVKRTFYNVKRNSFDEWLWKNCTENSNFSQLTVMEKFEKAKDGFLSTIKTPNGRKTVRSTHIVDATGAHSFTKTASGMRIPVLVAYQEWIKGSRQEHFGTIYSSETDGYYVWTIPKDGFTVVGTAFRPERVKEKISNFRKTVKSLGFKSMPERFESAIILRPCKDDIMFTDGGIMLAGESAGLIGPNTGEGISFALRSGEICAKVIERCTENPCHEYSESCMGLMKEIAEKGKIPVFDGNADGNSSSFGGTLKMNADRIK